MRTGVSLAVESIWWSVMFWVVLVGFLFWWVFGVAATIIGLAGSLAVGLAMPLGCKGR